MIARADLGEHGVHRGHARVDLGPARVDDVQEQIGVDHLFERRAERLDQLVRQALHEPDRVGHEHHLATRETKATGRGIEGREELVFDERVGMRQPVEERRLARVRVTDQRDPREPRCGPAPCAACRASAPGSSGRARVAGCGARSAGGRPRAASRPVPAYRCPRPAGSAADRGPAAGASGSGAGPAPPAPCPSWLVACWAKMSRISATRSTTSRPKSASRLRCCAGESSSSNTTTSMSSASLSLRSSSALPLPT